MAHGKRLGRAKRLSASSLSARVRHWPPPPPSPRTLTTGHPPSSSCTTAAGSGGQVRGRAGSRRARRWPWRRGGSVGEAGVAERRSTRRTSPAPTAATGSPCHRRLLSRRLPSTPPLSPLATDASSPVPHRRLLSRTANAILRTPRLKTITTSSGAMAAMESRRLGAEGQSRRRRVGGQRGRPHAPPAPPRSSSPVATDALLCALADLRQREREGERERKRFRKRGSKMGDKM